jgi:hypothetical protein
MERISEDLDWYAQVDVIFSSKTRREQWKGATLQRDLKHGVMCIVR